MLQKARSGPAPSVLATDSASRSTRRSAAVTGIVTYGTETRNKTRNDPQKPRNGVKDTQAKPATYEGIANGRVVATVQKDRIANVVRAVGSAGLLGGVTAAFARRERRRRKKLAERAAREAEKEPPRETMAQALRRARELADSVRPSNG